MSLAARRNGCICRLHVSRASCKTDFLCILYSTESCLFLQAWLYAKVEAAHQARLNQPDPSIEKQKKVERLKEANTAYTEWLEMKRKQDKALREVEGRRRADEAAQYAIRDRQLCDEAFRR